jgi:hypothetical protein
MPKTTVFLLSIIDSNSLHRPIRELHQDDGISNQINLYYLERGLPVLYEGLVETSVSRLDVSNPKGIDDP